ncbi:cotranscriptional regulator FAM172A isoform X3 [Hemicordylus capensis]|uniref:cotranscriptional regulator FAM172A isoform X3 n=1 Tax=Hemicordylus capensis TaxID=884348 RepID=UPI0023026E67|nr:cotranscriptional regulator FAM172A isoform X3 [Hemicordylus capensis]
MNYNFVVSKTDLLSRIDLDELMKKDEPPLEFPDTLEGFEYAFNEKGQLRHTKTGEPFVFNYREDLHRWNQKRYEALGEIITKYVYELLEEECHLEKVYIPVDATENEPRSFIFMSEDAMTNPDKLMILIHGSGVVRAGQWARRLIINEDLKSGTQIPYIKRAIEEGYGVIVLNPNENYIEVEKTKAQVQLSSDSSDEPAEKRERKDKIQKDTKKRRDFYEKYRNPQKEKETVQLYIRENGSPEEHAIYVWDHFISQSAAENVFFVAHSYGGLAFVELMIQREAEVKNKVTAVALTDSVHNVWHQEAGKSIREWMREVQSGTSSPPGRASRRSSSFSARRWRRGPARAKRLRHGARSASATKSCRAGGSWRLPARMNGSAVQALCSPSPSLDCFLPRAQGRRVYI